MSKTLEDKILDLQISIEEDREQVDKIHKAIQRKNRRLEKMLLEFNKDNMNDPQWLFKNPSQPGVHEATNSLFEELYGGRYNGFTPSGHHADDDYVPIQKSFDLTLQYGEREELKKNCDHFVENFLPMLDPIMETYSRWDDKFDEVKVVPFQFRAESSGLDYLGYDPKADEWFYFTLVYGRVDTKRKFNNWDEAFDFAYELSRKSEEEYSNEYDY